MIYLIKGNEEFLIQNKVKELTKGAEKDLNIHYFDGSLKTFNIQEMVETCLSISFFFDKNYVLVKNPYFLMKKVSDAELSLLYDYIKNPLYETDLIFYEEDQHFLSTLKSYKEIAKNAQVYDFDFLKPYDFERHCQEVLKQENIEMTSDAFYTFIRYLQNHLSLFYNYLEVLKVYPDRIDINAIEHLFNAPIEENVFLLINSITAKDLTNSMYYYKDLKSQYNSVIPLISLFSNQLRHLYHVAYLADKGFHLNDIANELNAKSFRIQKSLETLRIIKKEEILKILNELANLNFNIIKDDTIDADLAFECFIIKMIRG